MNKKGEIIIMSFKDYLKESLIQEAKYFSLKKSFVYVLL